MEKTGISIEVGRLQYSPLSIDGKIDERQSDCNLHINDDLGQIDNRYVVILGISIPGTGNVLARVQRVHKPVDLWEITFCTRRF